MPAEINGTDGEHQVAAHKVYFLQLQRELQENKTQLLALKSELRTQHTRLLKQKLAIEKKINFIFLDYTKISRTKYSGSYYF